MQLILRNNVSNKTETMDLTNYFNCLNQNNKNLLEAIDRIADDKLSKKTNGWSIYEILEHIYLTDKIIFSLISTPSENKSDTNEIIGTIELENVLIGKKYHKVKSPEILNPKGVIHDIQDFKNIFSKQRESLKVNLESGKIKVDNRIFKHPFLGEMTVEDWLNFVIFHTKRHIKQIEEKIL